MSEGRLVGARFLFLFCSDNKMNISTSNKDKYGEVFTPPFLVQQMIDDLNTTGLEDVMLTLSRAHKVFEPGAGKGVFFDVFVNQNNFFSEKDEFKYILNEINHEHLDDLQELSNQHGQSSEIILQDCLTLDVSHLEQCDLVIGNLPFNCHTKKFVPSLAKNNKCDKSVTQSKSITLWNKITHFCFQHILKPGGYFYAIIPCIWLKPDRGGIYDLFTRDHNIILLKTFDCRSANTMFQYNCQTPICYVLVQKKKTNIGLEPGTPSGIEPEKQFKLYDHGCGKYMDFELRPGKCIPTHCVSRFISYSQILKKRQISSCYEHVLKISTLHPSCLAGEIIRFSKGGLENYMEGSGCNDDEPDKTYKIITGSLFNKKTNVLTLNGFVSSVPCLYYGKPKLILPHKRLAKFFKDYDGSYSCFGRDMYVFLCDNKKQIDELCHFLEGNVNVNQMIESGFTIRMNFIEKYVFQYIPWIFDDGFDCDDYYLSS